MKLNDYLEANQMSQSAFAENIGTTTATVCRIASGGTIPRKGLLERIHEATSGVVTPNDLTGLYCSHPCLHAREDQPEENG